MAIEEEIYTTLTGNAAISALIGARVYNLRLPQDPTYPAVTYARISTNEDMAHDGPTGYETARFQIDSYATTSEIVRRVADTVRNVLNGVNGPGGGGIVHGIIFDNQLDEWGDLLDVWRITQDYMVQWRRS